MPLYVLDRGDLVNTAIPMALQSQLQRYHWDMLCQVMREAEGQAHASVFVCECVICIIFLFPCIFLFHPCVFLLLENGLKSSAANKLNRNLFSGAPVVTTNGGQIMINSDMIPMDQRPQNVAMIYQDSMSPMAQVTVIDAGGYASPATGIVVVSTQPQTANVVFASQPETIARPPATATSANGEPPLPPMAVVLPAPVREARQMKFQLPSQLHAGQVLTIMDPDGCTQHFVVEAHHQPGQEVVIPY